MGFVISVYTEQFFHEYVLPPVNNADYSLRLHKHHFGFGEDISVQLEVIDEKWKISPGEGYKLFVSGREEIKEPYELKSDDLLRLKSTDNVRVAVLFQEEETPFRPYKKYDITHATRITIGKNADNIICYDYRGMVSGFHGALQRQGNRWVVSCQGRNGLYLNNEYLTTEYELEFGDFINIIGLHIVFLGNELAIGVSDSVKIKGGALEG